MALDLVVTWSVVFYRRMAEADRDHSAGLTVADH